MNRPADLPEPPEIAEPDADLDRLAELPDIPHDGPEAEEVAIRATFRVRLTEESARHLDQTAVAYEDAARTAHGVPSYDRLYKAAGEDLIAVSILLGHYADHGGDGITRDQVRLAALVLDVAAEVERLGVRLMDAVAAAEGGESS